MTNNQNSISNLFFASQDKKIVNYVQLYINLLLDQSSAAASLLSDGYLFLMHSFSVIYENIIINHILPKTRFFGLHFCARECGITSTTLM